MGAANKDGKSNLQRPSPASCQVVSDQLRLWQADTHRVRAIPAVLYSGFETRGLWAGTSAKARELGAYLWQAPPRSAGTPPPLTKSLKALPPNPEPP